MMFGARKTDADPFDPSRLLERLEEGAAIFDDHGRLVAANGAWRRGVGAAPAELRLATGLFAPLLKARREGFADGWIPHPNGDVPVRIATLDERRFLIRLTPPPVSVTPEPPLSPAIPAVLSGPPAFGGAIIAPGDLFTARILDSNPQFARLVGQEVQSWMSLNDVLTPLSAIEAARKHAAGDAGAIDVVAAAAPDRALHLYLAPGETGATAWLLDVTEQKSMERQLAQRRKMEAIGQLAGGVAHDFNNLLTAIRLRVDELLMRHPLGDPAYEPLGEIRDTVLRAAELVRQLLTFSRKATTKRERLDIAETLMGFEILLRRLLREGVRLDTDYAANTPPVRADRAQLENAVINLVVNARDALKGGGRISLRCTGLTAMAAKDLGYPGPSVGEVALIEVADDGPGIAPDIAAHIFEPFYTTKGVGGGDRPRPCHRLWRGQAGRGLGDRGFQTGKRRGVPHLPARGAAGTGAGDAAPPPVRAPARDLSGAGRILLVEDEPSVRGIAARLLRTRGYEVLEAADGEAALEIARAEAGKIDLMISDVIMPGMDGPALLKAARPYLGAAPVMFISGYAEAEFSDLLEGEAGVSFLPKPLDIMSLAEQVKLRLQGR